MTSVDRYILRQCLGMMAFVTAALTAAVWLAQSLRLVELIVNRGLSIAMFLYLALLILPRFLDVVLPVGGFIAVLFVFNRLTTESELVVMRAAGLSPIALAKPVLILAAIAFSVLMSMSVYFLPASNRAFKDLQFEIRNRFVSSLLQEGTFNTISNKLTIYVRNRNAHGEVSGILINDSRDPQRPVTILASRGAFVDTPKGARLIMVNGSRQQYDRQTKKLSILTFDRYTLDLAALRNAPATRFHDPEERSFGALFFPPAGIDPTMRQAFLAEANQRIIVPLSAFTLAILPLVCLLPGEFNRRGQTKRVFLAVLIAFAFESVDVGARDLANRYMAAIWLMYVINLSPFAIGLAILFGSSTRFTSRWRFLPAFLAR